MKPPPYRFDITDRGRPDRRGGAHRRLRPLADHAAAGADHRQAAARVQAQPLRRAPPAGGAWATRKPSTSASSRHSWERDLAGNADPIRLLNPIASQMSVMRSSLLGSLLQALKFNLDRKAERVRVFELGRVFLRDAAVDDYRQHRARHPPADAGGGPGLRRR